MIKKYESTIVIDGSLPAERAIAEKEKIEKFLSENGKLLEVLDWGKRELAYEINKKKSGYYWIFIFEAEGDINGKLSNFLKFNNNILRMLTLNYTGITLDDINKAHKRISEEKSAAEAARKEANEEVSVEGDK